MERNDAEDISKEKAATGCSFRAVEGGVAETCNRAWGWSGEEVPRRQVKDGVHIDDGFRALVLGRIHGRAPFGIRRRANVYYSGTQGARDVSGIEDRNLPGEGSYPSERVVQHSVGCETLFRSAVLCRIQHRWLRTGVGAGFGSRCRTSVRGNRVLGRERCAQRLSTPARFWSKNARADSGCGRRNTHRSGPRPFRQCARHHPEPELQGSRKLN